MKTLTLLFLSVGGEATVAAIESLRQDCRIPERLRFVGCDTDADKRAFINLDHFEVSPRRDDPEYLSFLIRLCEREGIDVLWPNSTDDQIFMIDHRENFEAKGIRVLLPPDHGLEILSNKKRTYEFASNIGLRVPRWKSVSNWDELCESAYSFGYPQKPVVFRRTYGRGGIGVRILAETPDLAYNYFNSLPDGKVIPLPSLQHIIKGYGDWPECIACEYLPGVEFDVDCFCSPRGFQIGIPRRNDAYWWGTSSRAETVQRMDLVEICKYLLEAIAWRYICSVQFREDADGIPAIVEVNCRMPASINLSWKAGCNLPLAALFMALGREIPAFPSPQWGVKLVRYFGESFLKPDGYI